jgi:hypothetical protein
MILVLVSLGVSVIIFILGFLVYRFVAIKESHAQVASSSGVKGKKRSPSSKARSGGTAKTTQMIGNGMFDGCLMFRQSRTKVEDQELGNTTRSEGN